jgi:hypothetical protein
MYRETWTVLSGWYNIYRESHLDWILKLRILELVVLYYIPPTEMEENKKGFLFSFYIRRRNRWSFVSALFFDVYWYVVPQSDSPAETVSILRLVSPSPFNVCGRTRMRLCQQMTPCHRRNNGQQLNWINSTRAESFFFPSKQWRIK